MRYYVFELNRLHRRAPTMLPVTQD